MAENIDAARRLDDGRTAVDVIAEYVWACRAVGYHHPDLTGHPAQVGDLYSTEEGLDLRVLDAESSALTTLTRVAEQESAVQDNHFRALQQDWRGAGGLAATDYLQRHAAASAQVVAGMRSAAETLTRLRDRLWQAVDDKVAATLRIEGSHAGDRTAWLAAARAVNTGSGDRARASELVDTQVKPFVAAAIAGEWVPTMRAGTTAVADAYADALGALRALPRAVFAIPEGLGGVRHPRAPAVRTVAAAVPSYSVGPASVPAWSTPVAPQQVPATTGLPTPLTPAPPPSLPALGDPGMLGSAAAPPLGGAGLGSGLGDATGGYGGGIGQAGRQLADLFGGLLGSVADGVPGVGDDSALDLPEDEPLDRDEPDEDEAEPDEEEPEEEAEPDEEPEEEATQSLSEPDTATPEAVPVQPAPTPPADPPPIEAPVEPVAETPADGTPCAIAADELPQVGG